MKFHIIQCNDGKYRIGFTSDQYTETGVSYILMLAETYELGEEPPHGPKVENEFNTFWEAKKAVDQLN